MREQIEQKKNLVEMQKESQKAQEEMINVANDEAMHEQNLKQLQTKAEIQQFWKDQRESIKEISEREKEAAEILQKQIAV